MDDKAVPVWEVWNWTHDDRLLFGWALVLFATFVTGLFTGRGKEYINEWWAIGAIAAGIVGVGLLIYQPR